MNCQLGSLSSLPQEQTEQHYSQPPTRAVEEGCLCSNVMLTFSQIPSLNKRWTGHMQLRHTPTSKKCHLSSPDNASAGQRAFTTSADPQQLQGKQLQVYTIVQQHMEAEAPSPLKMIVSGTAGTGKSYLIHCLRLLGDKVCVAAPTGVAAFNIEGHTLHSLLSLPTKGEYKDLEGRCLVNLTSVFAKCSLIMLISCLEAAPACCLETLVNYCQ